MTTSSAARPVHPHLLCFALCPPLVYCALYTSIYTSIYCALQSTLTCIALLCVLHCSVHCSPPSLALLCVHPQSYTALHCIALLCVLQSSSLHCLVPEQSTLLGLILRCALCFVHCSAPSVHCIALCPPDQGVFPTSMCTSTT